MFQQIAYIAGLLYLFDGESMYRLIHVVHDMGAFYRHTINRILSRSHLNSSYITYFAAMIIGTIADKTALYDDAVSLRRNHKVAALIRHTATKLCRVDRIEDCNVGVGQRLPLFVNNDSHQVTVCLLYALHKNLFPVFIGTGSDADGIETDHLLDGFRQVFVLDSSSDTKVLQFVVEEVDSIVSLLLTELSQRIREGYVMVFASYSFLCLCADCQQQGKNNNSYTSIHGG